MRNTKILKNCNSRLCTCLHHMVILRTRNKITDFLMILAWASPFKIRHYSNFTITFPTIWRCAGEILAKAALDKTKQFYYIPYTDFKYNISVYLDDILQGEWNINITSKLFEVQPIIKRSFTPMERRRDDVVLCRARIGHAYFTNGYLLRGELRPMCCNTRLTVRHVLLSCAKYAHIRTNFFSFNSPFEIFRDTPAVYYPVPTGM